MNDEHDLGLSRLFAETSESPADEAFVAGVSARTSRERRILLVVRPLVVALVGALIIAALATGLGLVVNQARPLIALLASSPQGWVCSLALAFAGIVVVRTLAPVVRSMRR